MKHGRTFSGRRRSFTFSVSDLSENKVRPAIVWARAQVSRSAFYLHFRSKEELLLSHVDVIFDEFHAEVSREIARGNIDQKRFSLMLFQYWERSAETLWMVIQAEPPDILWERLKEYIGVIMKAVAAKTRKPARDPRLQEFIVGYVAGGAYM